MRAPDGSAAAGARDLGPSLARLSGVALRKMVDTRSGRWLLVMVLLVEAGMVALDLCAAPRTDRSLVGLFSASQLSVAVLLPVLGVLSVTGEWSRRDVLVTYTLVPRRGRVLAATLLASTVLTTGAVFGGLLLAAVGRGLGGLAGIDDAGATVPPEVVGTTLLAGVLGVVIGVGLGAVLLNTPLAVVVYFLVPISWSILAANIAALRGVSRWLDIGLVLDPLYSEGMTGVDWARVGTATALWLVLPVCVGFARITRRDVA